VTAFRFRSLRFRSLKSRLVALTLLVVGAVWIAAAAFTWYEARHEAEEVFDAHLVQAASLLIAQTALELEDEEELQDTHAPTLHRYARKVAFQVWVEGRLQVHSQHAPQVPLSDVREGFSDRTIDGEGWRVFSGFNAQREALVQVGERHSARQALAREIAGGLLKPLLVALPLLALLIWWGAGRALAPLAGAAAATGGRPPACRPRCNPSWSGSTSCSGGSRRASSTSADSRPTPRTSCARRWPACGRRLRSRRRARAVAATTWLAKRRSRRCSMAAIA
jgi:hypothetical protein